MAADRFPRRRLLLLGLGTLVLADLVMAFAASAWQVLVGAALWGLQLGLTPGLFSKLVADEAPEELRGTAFGVYQLVGGVAVLGASLLAGALWDRFGPAATFAAGALFAALTGVGILARRPLPIGPR
jgi:MFS family permease